MTEAEWLASEDPAAMLGDCQSLLSDRKHRLFLVACYRECSPPDATLASSPFALLAERFADGSASVDEVQLAYATARHARWPEPFESFAATALSQAWALREWTRGRWAIRPAQHAALLHCICGNPFRPVTFPPEWRTDTAVTLARQMYESRDFGAMPILADALQEVGCDNEDILNHCRAGGVHVRGCWVVDLVLGKA